MSRQANKFIAPGIAIEKVQSIYGDKAVITDSSGNLTNSSLAAAQLLTISTVTSNVQSQLNAKVESSLLGQNSGVATLDSGGKVPASQLPNSVMSYLGTWAASTNTPSLVNGVGNAGDVYVASDAGTVNFGAGNITFAAGDWVIYSGSVWEKSINSNAVASVNSQTGAVVLTTTNIAEGSNLYYTDSRAQAAVTGAASSIVTANLTASRALTSDGSGKVAVSAVTSTELGYISGVTSAIQSQLDSKTGFTALAVNSNVTLTPARVHIVSTGAARTLTLPAAASNTNASLVVKDGSTNAGINNITVNSAGGNIDGSSSFILNTNNQSATFFSDGTNWFVI